MPDKETQQREADALAVRFQGVNKAEFARKHDIPGGKSMLSQQIGGHRPIGMEAAIAYAKGFGVTLRDISPSNASILEDAIEKGLVGDAKQDLQMEQIRLLLNQAADRDAAFLRVTEELTKYLIQK